ncbi:TetR/AcrR family transcriptional regulator [Uliginosibacterium sp. sgz301328]|uniref:TetR/AcrR family transcriptional regulator n=1 Tax=Uliginosibacterium sp. sgz301328 TaxID=3243764 RepID=UPI00359DE97A
MVTAVGPRQRRKEARPGELLAAALDVFVERGFAATRLDEIAARAGVSKGTLYLYFDSKEALFKAVIQEALLPSLAEGEALFEQGRGDPERLLRDLVFGWWHLIGSSPAGGIPKLMVAEARNFPEVAQFYYDNVIARGRRLIVDTLELGMSSGVFRKGDPLMLCHVLFSPVLFAGIWQQSFALCEPAGMPYEEYLQTHVDIFMNGLRPRAASTP